MADAWRLVADSPERIALDLLRTILIDGIPTTDERQTRYPDAAAILTLYGQCLQAVLAAQGKRI